MPLNSESGFDHDAVIDHDDGSFTVKPGPRRDQPPSPTSEHGDGTATPANERDVSSPCSSSVAEPGRNAKAKQGGSDRPIRCRRCDDHDQSGVFFGLPSTFCPLCACLEA